MTTVITIDIKFFSIQKRKKSDVYGYNTFDIISSSTITMWVKLGIVIEKVYIFAVVMNYRINNKESCQRGSSFHD